MPRRALQPCTFPGCPELVPAGRCRAHAVNSQVNQGPSKHQRFYESPAWVKMSRRVLREEPTCRWPGCSHPSQSVDHIIAISDGGAPLERSNLQALCRRHHAIKTGQEKRARRRR